MPEGPEIRRAADKIAKVLEGKAIDRIEFAFAHLKPFEAGLSFEPVFREWVRINCSMLQKTSRGITQTDLIVHPNRSVRRLAGVGLKKKGMPLIQLRVLARYPKMD